jgi:hypothetical protein
VRTRATPRRAFETLCSTRTTSVRATSGRGLPSSRPPRVRARASHPRCRRHALRGGMAHASARFRPSRRSKAELLERPADRDRGARAEAAKRRRARPAARRPLRGPVPVCVRGTQADRDAVRVRGCRARKVAAAEEAAVRLVAAASAATATRVQGDEYDGEDDHSDDAGDCHPSKRHAVTRTPLRVGNRMNQASRWTQRRR